MRARCDPVRERAVSDTVRIVSRISIGCDLALAYPRIPITTPEK